MWWLEITLDYSLLLPAVDRQPFTWCTIKKPSDKIFKIHTETPVPESHKVMLSTKLNGLKPAAFKTRLNESCFHKYSELYEIFQHNFFIAEQLRADFFLSFSIDFLEKACRKFILVHNFQNMPLNRQYHLGSVNCLSFDVNEPYP